jgi:hypothetical protein
MNGLPRSIADLCGVMLDAAGKASSPATARHSNPIEWRENGDGTFTLTFFDKTVGWVNKTKLDRREGKAYRAVTIHGNVRLCWSERMARDWLLSEYH